MPIWGNLEVAEIANQFADDYILLETKQDILDAFYNVKKEDLLDEDTEDDNEPTAEDTKHEEVMQKISNL